MAQINSIVKNMTTNEMANAHRYNYIAMDSYGRVFNPFDKGCNENCLEVMYPSKGVTPVVWRTRCSKRSGNGSWTRRTLCGRPKPSGERDINFIPRLQRARWEKTMMRREHDAASTNQFVELVADIGQHLPLFFVHQTTDRYNSK